MTIDTIVGGVFEELSKTPMERVERMDGLVKRLNDTAEALFHERARLRARPGMSLSVNTTQAHTDRLTISVRVQGVDCGSVVFEAARMFTPSKNKNFKKQWKSDKPTLEWREKGVAEFVAACDREAKRYRQRESSVQELLFLAMSGGGSKKTGPLRGFQPVFLRRRSYPDSLASHAARRSREARHWHRPSESAQSDSVGFRQKPSEPFQVRVRGFEPNLFARARRADV